MSADDVSVVLAHGAWADGSSWSKVIVALNAKGVAAIAAPLPLTSLSDDVVALDRASERVAGQIVLVGHAYAGAVIGSTRNQRVKSLVYVAGLAPAEGETVADVFHRAAPDPRAPKLAPDGHGLIWLPSDAFAAAFAQDATNEEHALLCRAAADFRGLYLYRCWTSPLGGPPQLVSHRRARPDDRSRDPTADGRSHEGAGVLALRGPHAPRHRTGDCRRAHYGGCS